LCRLKFARSDVYKTQIKKNLITIENFRLINEKITQRNKHLSLKNFVRINVLLFTRLCSFSREAEIKMAYLRKSWDESCKYI